MVDKRAKKCEKYFSEYNSRIEEQMIKT